MIFKKHAFLRLCVLGAAGCLLSGCGDRPKEILIKTPKGFYSGYSESNATLLIRSCIRDSKSEFRFAQMKVIRASFYGSPPTDVIKTTYASLDERPATDYFFKLEDAKALNNAFYCEVKRQLSEKFPQPMKYTEFLDVDLSRVPSN